jgi:hypothetical protein
MRAHAHEGGVERGGQRLELDSATAETGREGEARDRSSHTPHPTALTRRIYWSLPKVLSCCTWLTNTSPVCFLLLTDYVSVVRLTKHRARLPTGLRSNPSTPASQSSVLTLKYSRRLILFLFTRLQFTVMDLQACPVS